jgi:ubiquinone/menaquinone biosynthesis C-methylase UbiE
MEPVPKNRARYNRLVPFYEALVRLGRLGALTRFYEAVAQAIEPVPGGVVLDVGCGLGTLTPHLLPKVGRSGSVLGIDVADRMIERARSLAARQGWQNVRFERSDVAEFSFHGEADVVVFCLSLTALPDPKGRLSQALSWLKPGGQLVILDSIRERDRRLAGLAIRLKAPLFGGDSTALTLEDVSSRLDSAQLRRLYAGVFTLVWGRKRRAQPHDGFVSRAQ